MLATRARLLVAALWAGSLWTIGYVVAPTLFLSLHDNVLAGTIVGFLLRTEAWTGDGLRGACCTCWWRSRRLEPARKRTLSLLIVRDAGVRAGDLSSACSR